jgi:DDE superfamily endonuclease
VDLWWSGEHAAHGGHVQVVAAPDSWRIWTSDARPGREHDTTARRAHAEVLRLLDEWTDHTHAALTPPWPTWATRASADADHADQAPRRPSAHRRPAHRQPAARRHPRPGRTRQPLLQETFEGPRRVRVCPWRIGAITAAARVLLHHEHDRTT